MSSEHPKDNPNCKSDDHTRHLCYFVFYGYHEDNPEDYRTLVDEPRFECYICGRTARNAESLCDPRGLK